MIALTAPDTIVLGQPFTFSFTSETRVAGRIRLTAGTEAVSFVLERDGRPPESGTSPRGVRLDRERQALIRLCLLLGQEGTCDDPSDDFKSVSARTGVGLGPVLGWLRGG